MSLATKKIQLGTFICDISRIKDKKEDMWLKKLHFTESLISKTFMKQLSTAL